MTAPFAAERSKAITQPNWLPSRVKLTVPVNGRITSPSLRHRDAWYTGSRMPTRKPSALAVRRTGSPQDLHTGHIPAARARATVEEKAKEET